MRGQGLQGKGRRLIGSIGGTAAPWGGVVKFIDSIGRHLVESRVPEPQLRVSGFADLEQAKSFLSHRGPCRRAATKGHGSKLASGALRFGRSLHNQVRVRKGSVRVLVA